MTRLHTPKQYFTTLSAALLVVCMFAHVYAGTLSCTLTTVALCTGTKVLQMSSTTNAQAEIGGGVNFTNQVVCCTGVTGLGSSCSGTFAIAAKLSSTTNAHIEQNSQSNYPVNACLSVGVGSVTLGYQNNNCSGYDTALFSMSSTTNAHVGTSTAYTIKACASADNVVAVQSLTFTLSASSISFGLLSASGPQYASSTGLGSSIPVVAHTITASSSGISSYQIYVQGQTLTSAQNASNTIASIGGVNSASTPGSEQFGIKVATTSGNGSISAPYYGSGYGYSSTATTSSQIGGGLGDGVTTVYNLTYIANIGALTEAGSYSAGLVYVAIANF